MSRGPAFVALFAVSALLGGCGQVVSGHPAPADSVAVGTTAPPTTGAGSDQVSLRVLAGRWTGAYRCGQGETALTLTIDPPDGTIASAVFDFGPSPVNPAVPHGSFAMGVGYVHDVLTFTQRRWITRPTTYSMVDLVAVEVSPVRLAGTVNGQGCTTFTVTRDRG
ncbi:MULTISPECIES: hypothetical protein [Nocardia]|uniref:hypothetical protein n=1 Tax=Nocardia TaxID=1817 RepID=UPI000D695764|nr:MULTISPECIES: hypothetical protein [Nocardia]